MTLKRLGLFCLLPFALGLPVRADFIAVGGGQISRINEQTGAAQILGSTSGALLFTLTRDPTTNLFYTVDSNAAGNRLFTLNPNTGQLSLVAPLTLNGAPFSVSIRGALAAGPNGLLYAAGNGDGNLYTIDPRTGQMVRVGFMGRPFYGVYGLAFAPDGTLYGHTSTNTEQGATGPGLFRLDPATAVPTVLTPPGVQQPLTEAIAFAPDGTLWADFLNTFGQRDPRTGLAVGPVRGTGPLLEGFAFLPTAPVPEPSTVLLLGAGLLGLCALRRRNRQH